MPRAGGWTPYPGAITATHLKLTQGSSYQGSLGIGAEVDITINQYTHNIRGYATVTGQPICTRWLFNLGGSVYSDKIRSKNEGSGAFTGYIVWDYHGASKPAEIWMEKNGGVIIQAWKSELEGAEPPIVARAGGKVFKVKQAEADKLDKFSLQEIIEGYDYDEKEEKFKEKEKP